MSIRNIFFVLFRKKLYNPSDPRDAEELLNYLEHLSSDDEDFNVIKKCNEMQLVLVPPDDTADSDKDDAPSDGEGITSMELPRVIPCITG